MQLEYMQNIIFRMKSCDIYELYFYVLNKAAYLDSEKIL